jgi:hypothetical protein
MVIITMEIITIDIIHIEIITMEIISIEITIISNEIERERTFPYTKGLAMKQLAIVRNIACFIFMKYNKTYNISLT